MAITWVREDRNGRGVRKEQSRTLYLRDFLILSDDPDETEDAIRTATGVPRLYEDHPTAAGARVEDIDIRTDQGSPVLWRATVSYGTHVVPADTESPLDRPKGMRWTYTPVTVPVEKAYNLATGELTVPIQNSAKMPFVPAPEISIDIPTLHITRFQSSFDPDVPLAYERTVNSDTFFGAPAGLARYVSAEATLIYESTGNYWQVDWIFQFQREGWVLKVADMGLYEWWGFDPNTGKPRLFPIKQKDIDGNDLMDDVTSPVHLNGAGRVAAQGQVHYLNFDIYKPKAYGPLNLE